MTDTLVRIEQTLDTLRPYIASHRGMVEVVDFDESEGTLVLRLGGTCSGCSASSITLRQGIEARLRNWSRRSSKSMLSRAVDGGPWLLLPAHCTRSPNVA